MGGFFFWEDGDIRRESPYEEFLLEGEPSLTGDRHIVTPPDRLPDAGSSRPEWPSPEPPKAGNTEDDLNSATAHNPVSDRRPARPAWPRPRPAEVENPARRFN